MIATSDGTETYVFYIYDIGGMNIRYANPLIGYVADGTIVRKQNSPDGSYLRRAEFVEGGTLKHIQTLLIKAVTQ